MFCLKANLTNHAKSGARNKQTDQAHLDSAASHLSSAQAHLVEAGASVTDEGKAFDNSLKALGKTDTELTVGNYLIIFGGRDLTGFQRGFSTGTYPITPNPDGSLGERFSKSVVVDSRYTATGRLAQDWEHEAAPDDGPDIPSGKYIKGPGKGDVLGYVDWSTAERDEKGIFVKRVLDRRKKYMEWIEPLIDAGMVGTSSKAIEEQIVRTKGGEITRWPLESDTLTVTPYETRMMTENVVTALKALGIPEKAVQPAPDGAQAKPNPKKPLPVPAKPQDAGAANAQPPDPNAPEATPQTGQEDSTGGTGNFMGFELDGAFYVYDTDAQGEAVGNPMSGPYGKPEEAVAAAAAQLTTEKPAPDPNAPDLPPLKPNTDTAQPAPAGKPGKGILTMAELTEIEKLTAQITDLAGTVKALTESPRLGTPAGGSEAAQVAQPVRPFKSLGEQLAAIKDVEMKRPNYQEQGNKLDSVTKDIAKKALGNSEQSGADIGFPLQSDFSSETLGRIYGTGEVLSRVQNRVVGAGFNGIKVNVINETSRVNGSRFGGVLAYWLNEAGTFTGSRPKMRQFNLDLQKLIGLYYATDEVLQDITALGSDVDSSFSQEIRFRAEDAIINGPGGGLPLGVVGHAATLDIAKESGQSSATVLYKNLSKMYARLWAQDRVGAAWFINQDVLPTLDDLFQAVGTAGIPPYFVTYSPEGIMKIKGLPVVVLEYCQTAGTSGDIILGNFQNYRWIDKGGAKSDSSIHVAFTTDEMAFRWVYRCNGAPFDIAPLTPKNGTNTLAHFLTLATR